MTKHLARVLPIALALTATPGFAEQYEILLVEGGFFPEITYLAPGDSVIFTNITESSENVVAVDASWTTSQIPSNGSEIMPVTAEMGLAFVYDESSEEPKAGTFSFDPAPVQ